MEPVTVVLLRAEHGGAFLWDRSPTGIGNLDPRSLDLPVGLVEALDDWNVRYEQRASRWDWGDPPPEHAADEAVEEATWRTEGLQLAHRLQRALDGRDPAVDVVYAEDDDPRPLRERRGR